MAEFQAPPGTHDVLPPESVRWQRLVALFAQSANRAGYGLVVGPMFEDIGVFQRVGASTDVVRKEMYDFEDKGGRHIALRPEPTASVMRAYIQHRPTTPFKAWYVSPNFRYERAAKGRYRQHHQVGVEVLGVDDPDLDVEVIGIAASLFRDSALSRVTLQLNSLGDRACRPRYRAELLGYLQERREQLCSEHRDRIEENPLRILDCKRETCRSATIDAPSIIDYLCIDCQQHFERVQKGLRALEIPFVISHRLVRGLDYYTRTTFEFVAEALDAAQNAVGGGGRYDGLAEDLGGPPTPGIGFGIGVERVLLACDAEGVFEAPNGQVDIYVVDVTGGEIARDLTHELRAAGVSTDRSFGQRSMKAQLKNADRSGAKFAVIVGEDEIARGTVTLRDLREGGGQDTLDREDLIEQVRKRL